MIARHFHDVFFDGKSLADFGVHVSGTNTFNSPEIDVESVEVPGRNGDLHISNERFKNVELTYSAWIAGDEHIIGDRIVEFRRLASAFRSYLLKSRGAYKRLEDDYHPDEYRMAAYKGPFSTEALFLQAGEFDLTFDCMPQRFLKQGEHVINITESGTVIVNPTDFDARPLLKLYHPDGVHGTVTIGDTTMGIDSAYTDTYLYLDCEIKDAYYGSNNCNGYVAFDENGDFLKLSPGDNTIEFTDQIQSIELTPRWWTI